MLLHSSDRRPTRRRSSAPALAIALALFFSSAASLAQDWGEDDDWGAPTERRRESTRRDDYREAADLRERIPGWSIRAGLGLTFDPGTLLINFEVPYAFDRWVSAGPAIQVGIDEHDTIVAPTFNLNVRVPDLPGEAFDRFHPFALVGIGFAVIEDDNRRNDNVSAGFLVDVGVGIEFQVSEHLYLSSQMMVNFLPEQTLDEDIFYSWQIGGVRIAF